MERPEDRRRLSRDDPGALPFADQPIPWISDAQARRWFCGGCQTMVGGPGEIHICGPQD